MKKIGIITAMFDELTALLKEVRLAREYVSGPYRVIECEYCETPFYVALCGVGSVLAAGATQLIIDRYGVDIIFNLGVCGALKHVFEIAQPVVVDSVVHYEFDVSGFDRTPKGKHGCFPDVEIPCNEKYNRTISEELGLKRVVCASGNKFISCEEDRELLVSGFDADICDMELAAVTIVARLHGVDVVSVKSVSDSAGVGYAEFKDAAIAKLTPVLSELFKIIA